MSRNLPKQSLRDFLSLRHPTHFVLAGGNNRKVTITYWFLAAPVQANRDFSYIDCVTVYFSCKYFPSYTRELLECLLGISPSGQNPCGGNKNSFESFRTDVKIGIFPIPIASFLKLFFKFFYCKWNTQKRKKNYTEWIK